MKLADLQVILNQTLPTGRLETVALPGCARIRLGLINSDFETGPLPGEVVQDVIRNPPYWCLCWGSGLALARFLLHDPSWVAGRTVADLGSGSGVVAIAAAKAGAGKVIACDTDPIARLATAANAELNDVSVGVTDVLPATCDIILMADVLYDSQNLPLLATAQTRAPEVLVADTRITEVPDPAYREVAQMAASTHPNLGEFDEFKTAHIFHWQAPLG